MSENSRMFRHWPSVFAGPRPFGLDPALGARYPYRPTPALLDRRQILRRLCVKQINCHSADTFSSPRNRNLRTPRADLIWPNTGSTMCLRAAYKALPVAEGPVNLFVSAQVGTRFAWSVSAKGR